MDGKYGQLFTMTDALNLIDQARNTDDDKGGLMGGGNFHFPSEEPLFLLRGKDLYALPTLQAYREICEEGGGVTEEHIINVDSAISEFEKFKEDNSSTMKVPD